MTAPHSSTPRHRAVRSRARSNRLQPSPGPPTTQAAAPVAASGQSNPNYDPCVPVASDVDYAGGSRNGPAYVRGPGTVVGTDVYGLDGNDNDGTGCE
jgi:hypothetical protein